MNKKQKIIITIGGLILFLGVGASWMFWWGKGNQGRTNPRPNNVSPTQSAQPTLSEKQKPKIDLDINQNRSGGTMTVSEIDDDFTELEYELIYSAEDDGQEIERGVAGGPVDIPESKTVSQELLFGTESCTTGVCHQRIDENVSQGTLIVRLINSDNQSWAIEKEFVIEETDSGYEAVFSE